MAKLKERSHDFEWLKDFLMKIIDHKDAINRVSCLNRTVFKWGSIFKHPPVYSHIAKGCEG